VIYRGETKATVTADAITNIEFDLYPQVPLLNLSPRAVEIDIEQSFSLTAKIFHVENLGSISFRVSYDNNSLKYDSALLHPDLNTLSSNITLDSQLNTSIPLSDLDLTVVSPDSISIVDNNGNANLAVIFFSARRQVTTTEITIEPNLLENTDGAIIDTSAIDLETDICQVQINIPFEDFIVDFPDYNLETVIRDELQKPDGDIYASDLLLIDYLYADSSNIANLSGLEHCTYLRGLYLSKNQISSISPLASLTKLQMLSLSYNQISDITPLSELTELSYLTLNDNQIIALSALSDLNVLQRLQLSNNQISDISPLSGLVNLRWLFLDDNLLGLGKLKMAFSGR